MIGNVFSPLLAPVLVNFLVNMEQMCIYSVQYIQCIMLSWSILIIINTSVQLASSILCLGKETIMKTSLYLLSIYLSFKTSLYKMSYRSSYSFSLFFSLYISFPILSLYSYLLSLYLSSLYIPISLSLCLCLSHSIFLSLSQS